MKLEDKIREKLGRAFSPSHLELVNESFMHNVPAESETHFRLIIVSSKFEGATRVERQKMIHEILLDELQCQVHALAIRTFTETEWIKLGSRVKAISPPCMGGGKSSLT